MDIYDQFRIVARAVTNYAIYSPQWHARVITVPHIKAVVQQKIGSPSTELPSVDAVLEEGTRRGFWEMDFDEHDELDIVIVR